MRRNRVLWMMIAALLTSMSVYADVVTPYQCNFERKIITTNHEFKVASNWRHVIDFGSEEGSSSAYMSYSYSETAGYGGSSCLYAGKQTENSTAMKDYLVTPLVKGTVTLRVKFNDTTSSYVDVYAADDEGVGELMASVNAEYIQDETGSAADISTWYQVTLPAVASYQRLYLRCNFVYIDDFEATSADITPEPSFSIESAEPSQTTGLITWLQQPNGNVLIDYVVTVTNDGDYTLEPGEEGYSITVFDNEAGTDLFTVSVPQTLAVGETSEEFHVSGEVSTDVWTTSQRYFYLRDNINNNIIERAWANYKAYAPSFLLREVGATAQLSSYSFGLITEEATEHVEIYNGGGAPLTVKSVVFPAPYTGAPEKEFVVEAGEAYQFDITLPVDKPGVYNDNVVITYLDKVASDASAKEKTYTLSLSGTVVDTTTWTCDFGTSDTTSQQYPEGTVAKAGISIDYSGYGSTRNNYIKGTTYNAHFYTPLLHLTPEKEISFDVKHIYNSSGSKVNVYITKDRYNWGDAVFAESSATSTSSFETKTISLADFEEGDYYVIFELPNSYVDNISAPQKVDCYDMFIVPSDSGSTTIQNGSEYSYKIEAYPTSTLAASDYQIELVANEEVVATTDSKAVTASAKNTVSFTIKWTPDVEHTTTFNTYARVTFEDGSSVTSDVREITVENKPDFVFFAKDTKVYSYKPSSITSAQDFGVVSESGSTKEYEIYNYGAAALTVTSITAPEGFSVNVSEAVVASKERQEVDLVFSTEIPGSYSGNLEIKYLDENGEEQTYTLAVTGRRLDGSLWYTDFPQSNNNATNSTAEWPAGTIHGSKVEMSNTGSTSSPIWAITSSSTADNQLITPLLHANAGDVMQLSAKLYNNSTNWSSGSVKVYVASTRAGLEDEEVRELVATISGQSSDASLLATDSYQDFNITMPEGEYYVGLAMTDRIYVSSVYGLTVVDVPHDLSLAGYSIVANAVQNISKQMSVSVRNFGLKAEEAGGYRVVAYVNGEKATASEGSVEIPLSYTLEATATTVPVPVRWPKVGTYPVSLELVAGDVVLRTDEVDVTFSEETAEAEVQIGDANKVDTGTPLNFNYDHSEGVMLFTADEMGLKDGQKIKKFYLKGYNSNTGFITGLKLAYQWVDDTALSVSYGAYDTSEMNMVAEEDSYTWPIVGSSTNPVEIISFDFDEPIIYEAGKSLKVYVSSSKVSGWTYKNYGFELTSSTANSYHLEYDSSMKSWTAKERPVLYMELESEPTLLTGEVTDNGVAVESATVTLVSADGENVQYEGKTDAEGHYSISIIQDTRSYDVTASTAGKEDFLLDQVYAGEAVQNFRLLPVVDLSEGVTACEEAVVKMDLGLKAGYNAVVLPISLSSAEVEALFGEWSTILQYGSSTLAESGELHMYFSNSESFEAGTPYLINVTKDTEAVRYRGKKVVSEITPSADSYVSFTGTYEEKALEEGMYLFRAENFEAVNAQARSAESVAPYTAYALAVHPDVTSMVYSIGDRIEDGVSEVCADLESEDAVIYNLQGMRVKKATRGVYIINGKKVMVTK